MHLLTECWRDVSAGMAFGADMTISAGVTFENKNKLY